MEQWKRWVSLGKHDPRPLKDPKEIVASTANGGDARYFLGVDIQALESRAAREGTEVPAGKSATVYKVLDAGAAVGASDGFESQWLRVESTSGTFHGHPITRARYAKYLKKRSKAAEAVNEVRAGTMKGDGDAS